jgi:hypothetical protein
MTLAAINNDRRDQTVNQRFTIVDAVFNEA